MKHTVSIISLIALLILSLATGNLAAETPEEKGLAIAKAAKARNEGWGDSEATMTMTLINKVGRKAIRKVRSRSLEVQGDGDKGLSIFDEPRDVKGTAFLSFTHIEGNDDQWLYLPALKRVKRISSSNKSGPWMGSEFANEDLSSFEIEKYSYKYLRDDTVNGEKVFVSELYPTYKNSGYSKTITYIDQEHYRIHKIEYYDKQDTLLKVMTFKDFKLYKDKFWRAHIQLMINEQTGKSTRIDWGEYQFNVGLDESDFTKSSLKRAK